MPETFAIVGENEPYPGAKKKVYVYWRRQPKHWASNGEIDLYPAGQVKSGIAVALTDTQPEQTSNLRDLKNPSSPLGSLPSKHSLTKGTLRIIEQEELDAILAESEPEVWLWDDYRTRRQSPNWWERY